MSGHVRGSSLWNAMQPQGNRPIVIISFTVWITSNIAMAVLSHIISNLLFKSNLPCVQGVTSSEFLYRNVSKTMKAFQ